jgi:glucoamylase
MAPDSEADPNTSMLQLANGGGLHPARNVVSGDFLHLIRLGIRAANDPLIIDSIKVMDRVLKRDLPQGPCWRRYNHDGYGQKDDGRAFDGSGTGRSWPILTGERGHYELAAGRDPKPFIVALENFANEGGMISEQLWDGEDLPDRRARRGLPTGAAMPLCWSHAEYLSLVRSAHDGVCFDRIEPAYQRYVVEKQSSSVEFWSFRHPVSRLLPNRRLRILLADEAEVVWTLDGWATSTRANCQYLEPLRLWFADLPVEKSKAGSRIEFTFFWKGAEKWEGKNFQIVVKEETQRPSLSTTAD